MGRDTLRLTAPADRALTVLHIIDPDGRTIADCHGEDKARIGTTICGRPMLTSENWQYLEQLPGERICPACTGHPDEQGTLL